MMPWVFVLRDKNSYNILKFTQSFSESLANLWKECNAVALPKIELLNK